MCKCWDDSCITHYISRPGSVAVAGVGGSRQQQCGAESCSVVRCLLGPVVRQTSRPPAGDTSCRPRSWAGVCLVAWGPRCPGEGVTMCGVVPVSAVLLLCSSQGQYTAKTLLPAPAHPPQSRRHATHFYSIDWNCSSTAFFANHHCDILGRVVTLSSADKWSNPL